MGRANGRRGAGIASPDPTAESLHRARVRVLEKKFQLVVLDACSSEGAAVAVGLGLDLLAAPGDRPGEVKMEIEVLPRSHTRLDRSSLSGGRQSLGRQTGRKA